MDKLKVAAIVADAVKAAWDEDAHPRHPAGRSEGGKFAPKSGGKGKDAAGDPNEAKPKGYWAQVDDIGAAVQSGETHNGAVEKAVEGINRMLAQAKFRKEGGAADREFAVQWLDEANKHLSTALSTLGRKGEAFTASADRQKGKYWDDVGEVSVAGDVVRKNAGAIGDELKQYRNWLNQARFQTGGGEERVEMTARLQRAQVALAKARQKAIQAHDVLIRGV